MPKCLRSSSTCSSLELELVLDAEEVLAKGLPPPLPPSAVPRHDVIGQSGDSRRGGSDLLLSRLLDNLFFLVLRMCTASMITTATMIPTTMSPPTTDTTAVKVKNRWSELFTGGGDGVELSRVVVEPWPAEPEKYNIHNHFWVIIIVKSRG